MIGLINNKNINLFIAVVLWFGRLVFVDAAENMYEPTPAHPDFQSVSFEEIQSALRELRVAPRLLLTDKMLADVHSKLETDNYWFKYYIALKAFADAKFESKPVERILTGRRLLSVSREVLLRIFDWSFLYRYTGDEKYAKRVEQESLAIAGFQDWNPSHFLDVAEMTVAMAIGYDSCKEIFSEENRTRIRDAIYTKGLVEALRFKGGWKRNTANWNQVCWCGALYGSLAIIDEVSDDNRLNLERLVWNAVNGVTWSMSSYEPDGNYTEGPGYWGYGTGFNILLVSALESALGRDFGRSDSPGFLKSIDYYEHVFGTTGAAFNYPDSGGGKLFEPTAFWYAYKTGRSGIPWNEMNAVLAAFRVAQGEGQSGDRSFGSLVRGRLAVAALLWGGAVSELNPPTKLGYIGKGSGLCCVALFRTAWRQDAAYLGVKCGVPMAPHGHLDEGSFVYDDGGVRWIVELGPEDYHKIESRGMNLWNMSQNSDRWKLLRYNNFGHSVPTINGKLQQVDGKTSFIETKIGDSGEESYAVIDLTPVYRNEVLKVERKVTLNPDGSLVVEDVFEALPDKSATIERRFLTPAKLEERDGTLYLIQHFLNGTSKNLTKKFTTTTNRAIAIERTVESCETQEEFDAKNPGVSVIKEGVTISPSEKIVFTTCFSPSVVE